MSDPIPLSDTLRTLVEASRKPLKRLANESGVTYRKVSYWFNTPGASLDVDDADRLYQTLTGRRLNK